MQKISEKLRIKKGISGHEPITAGLEKSQMYENFKTISMLQTYDIYVTMKQSYLCGKI